MDYENNKNPFEERKKQISKWRKHAAEDIEGSEQLIKIATRISSDGIKNIDSLHIACAVKANSDYFLTTDDGILKRATLIQGVNITDPIGFIKEVA